MFDCAHLFQVAPNDGLVTAIILKEILSKTENSVGPVRATFLMALFYSRKAYKGGHDLTLVLNAFLICKAAGTVYFFCKVIHSMKLPDRAPKISILLRSICNNGNQDILIYLFSSGTFKYMILIWILFWNMIDLLSHV